MKIQRNPFINHDWVGNQSKANSLLKSWPTRVMLFFHENFDEILFDEVFFDAIPLHDICYSLNLPTIQYKAFGGS
jgi:hypothetical protein